MSINSRQHRRLLKELQSTSAAWRRLVHRHADAHRQISIRESQDYQSVHGRLLSVCEDLMNEATENERDRDMIRQFTALVRPWHSTRPIHDSPKSIVDDLLKQERRLASEIIGSPDRRHWLNPALVALGIGITSALVVAALLYSLAEANPLWLRNLSYSLVNRIARFSLEGWLAILGVVAWILGTLAILSSVRR